MSFGEQLQLLRRANGLTQEEFAQQLKVSRQAVSKWESSKGYPEMEKIIYICNCYGVTMDELFNEEVPSSHRKAEDISVASPVEHRLETPPLQKAFGNFFSNLTPYHQLICSAAAGLVAIVLLVLFCTSIVKGESDQMTMQLIWTGLLVAFVIGEAATVGLASIWFAAGALAALVCALVGANLWVQLAAFILVSALSLLAFRPLASKYINSRVEPTNADRLIGAEALVTEDIHNLLGRGAVSVGGLTWSARSEKDELIAAGTLVRILRIEGVKVYVEQSKEEA